MNITYAMKYSLTLFLLFLTIFTQAQGINDEISSTQLPLDTEIMATLRKVNDKFMATFADCTLPASTADKVRPSNIWTRSVYYEGLIALLRIETRSEYRQKYMDYMLRWADFHKWRLSYGTYSRNADGQCCAQVYIDLYRLMKASGKANDTMLKDIRANQAVILEDENASDWTWIDAIYMAMPVMAKLGRVENDERYHDKMWQMYAWTRNECGGGLYNKHEGLWWRDAHFVPPYKEPNGENCYWSRGNGWVYAALARVLSEIDEEDDHYEDYINDFVSMSAALMRCQRSDGMWNVSLHDENHFGGRELTGTSLFVYGLAWGINHGLLNRQIFLPVVVKAWNALVHYCVREDGTLAYIQGTGKQPKDGQPVTTTSVPNFIDFGTGCFLLAGTEVVLIM